MESASSEMLRAELSDLLKDKIVTKIIGFGLGDMSREPPEWLQRQAKSNNSELARSFVRPSMVQHAIALTMAKLCGKGDESGTQLLAQDPDYSEQTKQVLTRNGFSIVGPHGAGGFAEIDDHTLVFSAFVEAPLKQIIADIARPVLIIGTGPDTFNNSE